MNRTGDYIMEGSRYYQLNKKKIWRYGLVLLLLIFILSILCITKTVTAQRATERIKLVTSIEVRKGDTLWNIAAAYVTEEYDNLYEYIEEIKDSNGLISDEIHAGNYIIVPYYAEAS